MTYLPNRDFLVDVARGEEPGFSVIHKYGRNPDIDNAVGTFECLWNGGGQYTGFDATSADTIDIYSSSANDTSAGTGARTIKIQGLDSSWNYATENFTLTGATQVVSTSTWMRVDRIEVLTAGTGGENAGTITVEQSGTPANVFAAVPIGYNQTMIAAYTVPLGKTAYMLGWFVSTVKNSANCSCRIRCRPDGGVFHVKEEIQMFGGGTGYISREYRSPKNGFEAKTDIYVESDSDAANTIISGGFDLLLVDD